MEDFDFDLHVLPTDDGIHIEFTTEDGERAAYVLPRAETYELRDALTAALKAE